MSRTVPADSIEPQLLARLVAVACHDIRTPLATVFGFARTLERVELAPPTDRYIQMIEAAAVQLGELVDELSVIGRIASGRFELALVSANTLDVAWAAADELADRRMQVEGEGALVETDPDLLRRSLAQLGRAAARYSGLDTVELRVRGRELELSPVTPSSQPVLLGGEIRELSAAAASITLRALGGSLELAGERLVIRLP